MVTDFSNFHVVLGGDSTSGGGGGAIGGLASESLGGIAPQMYKNPFDIPRLGLLDQLARMRANFLQVSGLI